MSEEQALVLLLKTGKLCKRPIVTDGVAPYRRIQARGVRVGLGLMGLAE